LRIEADEIRSEKRYVTNNFTALGFMFLWLWQYDGILTGEVRTLGWCARIPDSINAKNFEPKLLLPQIYEKFNEMLLFIGILVNNLHFLTQAEFLPYSRIP
jgi:hypothetical protein